MPGKIFISYRRDDDPNAAARVRDGLVRPFGKANVFLDVDHLLAGQRFDEELAKALSQCDVLLAIIGPRWMEQLSARAVNGDRAYVREEIAAALARKIVVNPVRVGRDGQLVPLPRAADLPDDIPITYQLSSRPVQEGPCGDVTRARVTLRQAWPRRKCAPGPIPS